MSMSLARLQQPARSLARRTLSRQLHASAIRTATSNFLMPAMSPTMTEGGIASWKKKEGEKFSTGDIILEIETDKATMDVEAQDDGVMAKIVAPDGTKNVPVGRIIAVLAEEGDDISNIKVPEQDASSPPPPGSPPPSPPRSEPQTQSKPSESPSPPSPSHTSSHPHHSRPLFPSVLRLLQENNISDADKIKGTGVRGMLTKGDVLAHLGLASSPTGTLKPEPPKAAGSKDGAQAPVKQEQKVLDGDSLRRLILAGLQSSASPKVVKPAVEPSFDSIVSDYLKTSTPSPPPLPPLRPTQAKTPASYFDGLI